MNGNILVYHNITGIAEIMLRLLEKDSIGVYIAESMEELLKKVREEETHLILIDADLTEIGGEVIHYLRSHTYLPIIAVTAKKEEGAEIQALEAGADDYLSAEDHPLVLAARVRAHLNRYFQIVGEKKQEAAGHIYRVGEIEMDDRTHCVTVGGRNVKMTPIEYKILRLLIREQGKVLSIETIYETIWKMHAVRVDNTIAVHIRHIREKIEINPKKPCYLKAVRGMGYKVG